MTRLLLIPFLFFQLFTFAEPVDTTEAKQIAINFFQYKNPNKSWAGIKQTKIKIYKGLTTRYTFVMEDNSFIIVSADNSTTPILAYSDNGTFNENYSPSFDYWMQTEYDEWVVYNKKNNVTNKNTIQKWNNIRNKSFNQNKSINSVSPLIATKWGQSYPNDGYSICAYNYYIQSSSCGCGHCTAGCVATAMAQIMKFWQDTGNDFDWCNMVNELFYDNNQNTNYVSERNAIAELIEDCGDKTEMKYCSNNCSSSSTIWKARQAFRNDYNYSNDMDRRYRSLTPWWKTKMRNSLDGGMPILYGGNRKKIDSNGNTSYPGHAFVCDGYGSDDDYFHFNWGNRGYDDGYFYIKDDDGSPVIDYYKWQEAVFYLHPESSSSVLCVDCNESINISNWVNYNNPYNSDFPLIQWTGIPIEYSLYVNTGSYPFYEQKPFYSEIISENGETRLEYNDIKAGVINVNNVVIPDKVNVHLKAYDSIVLTNFSTEEGAEFTAEIIPCPNTSGNKSINTENEIIEIKDNINTSKEGFKIFPNPCSYETTITYSTNEKEKFEISIYNIYGQKLQSLINGIQNEGIYNLIFKTTELENGVYICVFSSEQRIAEIKFVKNE